MYIAINVVVPDNISELDLENFIEALVKDIRIQPRSLTYGSAPAGNPDYLVSDIITGEWEFAG